MKRTLLARISLVLAVVFGWAFVAAGQTARRPQDDARSFRNNSRVMAALAPAVAVPARSVVTVVSGDKEVALGTVVSADGYVLTKNSEVADEAEVSVRLADGRTLPAEVTGNDAKLDLVMLKVGATNLTPVEWRDSTSAMVGDLLATPGPDGEAIAVGVVSVASRKTKLTDLPPSTPPANSGFLGVALEEGEGGARIMSVTPDSAADKAGLQVGDVVKVIAGVQIIDTETMINTIQHHKPGDVVAIRIERDGEEQTVNATLGKRAPEAARNRRDYQNRLGGELSNRRGGFPAVLQHDTVLKPSECGGPLVDLDGRVIGINIARAGRVESYALPAEVVRPAIERLKGGSFTPVSTPATRPAKAADRAEAFSAPRGR